MCADGERSALARSGPGTFVPATVGGSHAQRLCVSGGFNAAHAARSRARTADARMARLSPAACVMTLGNVEGGCGCAFRCEYECSGKQAGRNRQRDEGRTVDRTETRATRETQRDELRASQFDVTARAVCGAFRQLYSKITWHGFTHRPTLLPRYYPG